MILATDHGIGDAPTAPDFVVARNQGVGVAAIKLYQSPYGRDAAYSRDAPRARAAGLVVQTYLFPDCHLRADSPKHQVAAAFASTSDVIPNVDLPPGVDVEFPGGVGSYGISISKAGLVESIRQFVLEMSDRFGVPPALYTSYNQWYDLGLPAAGWASECPLWLKTAYRLRDHSPPDAVIPSKPHVGQSASDPKNYHRIPDPWLASGYYLNQFQGDAIHFPGGWRTVDLNYVNVVGPSSHDPLVKMIQRRLKLADDGSFGPVTEAAVRAVQSSRGLPSTGVVDPATLAAILWL